MARLVTLDISTLTLGEADQAERQSGLSIQEIVKTSSGRVLLAMFVHELRTSESKPSWSELSNLPLLDVSSSTQPSPSTETVEK